MGEITQREKRIGLHLTVEVRGEDTGGSRFKETAVTRNISGGGICFESHRKLMVGSPLTLEIQLPPGLRKHFGGRSVYRARAIVCRVEKFEPEEASRIGARFLGEAD
jgi:hypothetical protein